MYITWYFICYLEKFLIPVVLFGFQVKVAEDILIEADDSAADEKKSKSNKGNDKKAQEPAKPSNAASTSLCSLF